MSNFVLLTTILLWTTFFSATIAGPGLMSTSARESDSREVRDLSGVWNFKLGPILDPDLGFREQWYTSPLALSQSDVLQMPVPASYNEITPNGTIFNYVGWAWYDKEFHVPSRWLDGNSKVWLRFGSAHYNARVFLNGISVTNHSVGHLPFEVEVTTVLRPEGPNLVTVAVNNTLTPDSIPQGTINWRGPPNYPEGYFTLDYNFDFFNYAGIHRPVLLYTTPNTYISDLTVTTDINGTTGIVTYNVTYTGATATCSVELYDQSRALVVDASGCVGSLNVANAHFWWPNLMDAEVAYLYNLRVQLTFTGGEDIFVQPVGIRKISWDQDNLYVNSRPFYFRGFGMHEDHVTRGKGLDYASIVKDFNLLKWIGANSFRTSHYPYSDEIMDLADQTGIVIIDEVPAVALNSFQNSLLQNHLQALTELIQRDKNRPSVIAWSIANEPGSSNAEAGPYFNTVASLSRLLDPTRPVTMAVNADVNTDQASPSLDIIGINRYYAWYSDAGHVEIIRQQLVAEINRWRTKFNKPVLITEYGADTVAGLHMLPSFLFTEEYQDEFLYQYFLAFDDLRAQGQLIGEMIWNFADFLTKEEIRRVVGNKKGVFTRDRQPKSSAFLLRDRYFSLAESLHKSKVPTDLRKNMYCEKPRKYYHKKW